MGTTLKILSGAIALACASVVHAQAQTAPEQPTQADQALAAPKPPATLGAVTVTAQRREESLQETPVAVSAFTAQDLEERGVVSVADLATNVPSFSIRSGTSDNVTPLISLRGQSQTRSDTGKQPSVGLYYDEVYAGSLALSGVATGLVDVERMEVLRGPQGTLYGRNTPGGAVNIVSKLPTDELEGMAQLSAANHGQYSFAGVANFPLGERSALRLVGQFQQDDGYARDLSSGTDLGDNDVRSVRGTLRFDATDRLQLIGRAEYTKVKSGGTPYHNAVVLPGSLANLEARTVLGLPATPAGSAQALEAIRAGVPSDPYRNYYSDYAVGVDAALTTASLTALYSISDNVELKSITAWRQLERTTAQDADGTAFDFLRCSGKCFYFDGRQWTQDLQLSFDTMDGRWRSVLGAYYYDLDAEDDAIYTAGPHVNRAGLSTNLAHFDTKSSAVYGHSDFALTDSVNLVGGLRFTTEESRMQARNSNEIACAVPVADRVDGQCLGKFETSSDVWSWDVGMNWTPLKDVMVYGKVSRGFKGGGHNPLGSATNGSFTPFAPEFVTEYEIGAKMDFLEHRLRTNVAAYYTDYTDVQRAIVVAVPGGGVASITTNAASASVQGVELEMTALLGERWRLQGAASWTDAKYDDYQGLFGDRSNLPFPGLADWQVSTALTYAVPTSFGQVQLVADGYYQSKVDYIPDDRDAAIGNVGIQDGYALLGARIVLDFNDSNTTLTFYGRNLTDRGYISSALYTGPALGYAAVIPGASRSYGVQLTKRF
jgi:iron complex outermembrane receptor protein